MRYVNAKDLCYVALTSAESSRLVHPSTALPPLYFLTPVSTPCQNCGIRDPPNCWLVVGSRHKRAHIIGLSVAEAAGMLDLLSTALALFEIFIALGICPPSTLPLVSLPIQGSQHVRDSHCSRGREGPSSPQNPPSISASLELLHQAMGAEDPGIRRVRTR